MHSLKRVNINILLWNSKFSRPLTQNSSIVYIDLSSSLWCKLRFLKNWQVSIFFQGSKYSYPSLWLNCLASVKAFFITTAKISMPNTLFHKIIIYFWFTPGEKKNNKTRKKKKREGKKKKKNVDKYFIESKEVSNWFHLPPTCTFLPLQHKGSSSPWAESQLSFTSG